MVANKCSSRFGNYDCSTRTFTYSHVSSRFGQDNQFLCSILRYSLILNLLLLLYRLFHWDFFVLYLFYIHDLILLICCLCLWLILSFVFLNMFVSLLSFNRFWFGFAHYLFDKIIFFLCFCFSVKNKNYFFRLFWHIWSSISFHLYGNWPTKSTTLMHILFFWAWNLFDCVAVRSIFANV